MKQIRFFLSVLFLILMFVPVHAQDVPKDFDTKFYYRVSLGTHNSMEDEGREYLTLLNSGDQRPVIEELHRPEDLDHLTKGRQLWRIEDRGNGFVRLTNGMDKNKSLGTNSDDRLVLKITSDVNKDQEWKLTPFKDMPDTFVRLINRSWPNKSLTDTTDIDFDKRLALKETENLKSQMWVFIKTDVAVEEKFELTSTSFENGAKIPVKYTQDRLGGGDISPPLAWKGAPAGTKSFMIVCTDPDAPSPKNPDPNPFVHWIILNIPADTKYLLSGVPRLEQVSTPFGAVQGPNNFGEIGYSGPMPPKGSGKHRYIFTIFAMDRVHVIESKLTPEFIKILDSSVLAKAELMGTYEIP